MANKEMNDDGEFGLITEYPWICEINQEVAIRFHERLFLEFEKDPYKPIIIHINSYGGECDALFSMIDTMDAIRSIAPPEFKFLTVVKGKAISAGAALLAYGDFRFAEPNSRIMLHQIVGGAWGSHAANEVEFNEMTRINERLLQLLKKSCKLNTSMEDLKVKLNHNLYFTPEKAKEFGLIDIIGYPKLGEHKIYDIQVINGELPKERKTSASNRRTNKSSTKNKS